MRAKNHCDVHDCTTYNHVMYIACHVCMMVHCEHRSLILFPRITGYLEGLPAVGHDRLLVCIRESWSGLRLPGVYPLLKYSTSRSNQQCAKQ